MQQIKDIDPDKIAYVDESGIDSYFYREYAYAPRGEKVYGKISGRKFQRSNIVAAKLNDKIIAPMQYKGITNATLFENWFEQCLLPCLSKENVVIMDNASFHRKNELFQIAEKHHITLIFLPPYSPELNPIEKFWANLKYWLKMNAHHFDHIDDAIKAAFQEM